MKPYLDNERWNSVDLRTAVDMCQKLFEISDDGILMVDKNKKVLYINKTYCDVIGIPQEEAIGEPVEKIVKNTALLDRIRDKYYEPEKNIMWRTHPNQYTSKEKHAIVTRQVVLDDNGDLQGAVGQVKFLNTTLKLSKEIEELNDELSFYKAEYERKVVSDSGLRAIIGSSGAIQGAKHLMKKIAQNDFPVVITGESGTGKELFANAIHFYSDRKDEALISVNCAAIPEELFESELFGYVEGAFTGAKKSGKIGKIQQADKGTLFLDEIGDMPLSMQAKLLRVLQEKQIERVGDNTQIPVDVRIIAATNKDLREEVEKGKFRLDLYYRLDVAELKVPALRERKSDIAILANYFLDEINRKYKTDKKITPDDIELLENQSWPGNVRELRNAVERAYMLSEGDNIAPSDFRNLSNGKPRKSLKETPFSILKSNYERELILQGLEESDYNVENCAKLLDINRSTLYAKLAEYKKQGYKISRKK